MTSNTRAGLGRVIRNSLLEPAHNPDAEDHANPVRGRVVCIATLFAGAALLHWSLGVAPGDTLFYPATAGLALLWLVGGRLAGPGVRGHGRRADRAGVGRSLVESVVWGAMLLALFLAGAVVVSWIPVLAGPVHHLLDHARQGSLPIVALLTALNGLGEEYFFRGALFEALPRRRRVLASTLLYAVVTAFGGVPLLVLAAGLLGVLVGLQRRVTGGFLAPTVTHLVWSLGMLLLLPGALSVGERLLG